MMKMGWSNTPEDILLEIYKKLGNTCNDYVCFSAVCSHWRSAAVKGGLPILPASMIMTLETRPKGEMKQYDFYALSSSSANKYKIHVPEMEGKICLASDKGWIVALELDDDSSDQLFVFNPLSRKPPIMLPPVPSLMNVIQFKNQVNLSFISPSEFVVTAGFCRWYKLMVYKSNDNKWESRRMRSEFCSQDYVLYHNDHMLYVAYNRDNIEFFDKNKRFYRTDTPAADPYREDRQHSKRFYLVQSSDQKELLGISRNVEYINGSWFDYYTVGFDVYKLNKDTRSWKEVDDIGNQVVFLGANAQCLCAIDVPECKGNSIYFTDYNRTNDWPDMGFFNMGNKTINPLYSIDPPPFDSKPSFWFTPDLNL